MKKLFILLGLSALLLTGCKKQQIFLKKGQEYEQVLIKDKDLEPYKYYVKDGTNFISTYVPKGDSKLGFTDKSKVLYLEEDLSLVPLLTKGEFISYATSSLSLDEIEVKRYKDLGYSFGIKDAIYDEEEKALIFDVNTNLLDGSDAIDKFLDQESPLIKIVQIDGKNIDKASVSLAGTVLGLKEGKSYHISYYAGSYYKECDLIADKLILQEYEYFLLPPADRTKKGYFCIEMPSDFKPGYYAINGQNLFRYDYNKNLSTNLNEAYYIDEEQQLNKYAQRFILTLNHPTEEATIFASIYDKNASGAVISPTKETYVMDKRPDGLVLSIKNAVPGEYKVFISPKEAEIDDISLDSIETKDDAICDLSTVSIKSASEATIKISYEGDENSELWGFVEDAKGEIISSFTKPDKQTFIDLSFPRLEVGAYNVHVYHYNDIEKVAVKLEERASTTIIEIE